MPARRSTKTPVADRRDMDRLAAEMEQDKHIIQAARKLGMHRDRADVLWRRICADLGWQAQA